MSLNLSNLKKKMCVGLLCIGSIGLAGCESTGHYGHTHHYNNVWKKDIQSSKGKQISKRNWGVEEPLPMDPSSNVNPRRVFRRAPTLAEPNI